MARSFLKGFVKEALPQSESVEAEYGSEPFARRGEDEQADLFLQLHSLLAEARDLTRSVKEGQKEETQPFVFVVRNLHGRHIKVPVPSQGRETYAVAAVQRAQKRLKEIRAERERLAKVPGFREAYERKLLQTWFVARAAAHAEDLKSRNAEIEADIEALQQEALRGRAGAVSGAAREQIVLLKQEKTENDEKLNALVEYEDGRMVARLNQLRDYAGALSEGRMIEFPSAKETIDQGLDHMRSGQPFLLAGHLGSGKTELAKHMARLLMIETGAGYEPEEAADLNALYKKLEPEVFSGSDESSVYDLVGRLKLVGTSVSDPKVLEKRIGEISSGLEKIGIPGVPREELAKLIIGKGDATETAFNYGPFGRALKRGVPIIIDEINMVPPEVISRINDVMLRGVGDKVHLQENGEEALEVKPGFAVLATCNLGAQYAGIKKVNAAFKSRWVSKEVGYPSVEETYDLILASVLRKDRTRLPPDFPVEQLETLADLAIVSHEVQEIFSGRTEGQRFMAMAKSAAPEKSQLEESVISTRDLARKIIAVWKKSNFKEPLNDIIARNILAAMVDEPADQKFMAEIFVRRGFFRDWDEARFRAAGIHSVSKQELDALQAATGSEEYQDANRLFDGLRDQVRESMSLILPALLVGTKGTSGSKDV